MCEFYLRLGQEQGEYEQRLIRGRGIAVCRHKAFSEPRDTKMEAPCPSKSSKKLPGALQDPKKAIPTPVPNNCLLPNANTFLVLSRVQNAPPSKKKTGRRHRPPGLYNICHRFIHSPVYYKSNIGKLLPPTLDTAWLLAHIPMLLPSIC